MFSFDDIPGLEAEPTVEIDLGPDDDAASSAKRRKARRQARRALEGVTNVRVRVYEDIAEDMQSVLKFVDATATKLEGDGWRAVVRVREGGEQVRVYMKPGADGTLAGVTVMVTEAAAAMAATAAAARSRVHQRRRRRSSPSSSARLPRDRA